ncbi:hypothetical protein FGADI_382 [Fusarium gaditjirri]|uniref:2EXR domain-containing protein n=1 Tax=Fusarium gaditjirri TaxID=282569 RepID=A0A8H4TNF9_9HYPO|nr:hypothetical protein FGADI_382 [Fusarium gaditjirri]
MANFSDLPREIRDMIWPLVLRDNHPGVYIFGLFSGILSEPSPDRYFANLDKDRKNENISTYLIDGAMWNTCKESQLAIEKHFGQYEWPTDGFWDTRSDTRPYYGYPYDKVF